MHRHHHYLVHVVLWTVDSVRERGGKGRGEIKKGGREEEGEGERRNTCKREEGRSKEGIRTVSVKLIMYLSH